MFFELFKNVGGIIASPGQTLGKLMKEKKWLPVFLLILIVVGLYANMTLSSRMTRAAENPLISQYFPGEQLVDFQENITLPRRVFITTAAFINIFLGFVVAAFMVYLFFGIGGSEGYYINFFALIVNASVIDTLLPLIRDALSLVLNINLGHMTNLIVLFPALKPLNLDFWFVSQVDLFYIWYLIAIAAGAAVFAKMSLKKSLFIAFLFFLLKSVVSAFSSYLGIKIITSMMAGG